MNNKKLTQMAHLKRKIETLKNHSPKKWYYYFMTCGNILRLITPVVRDLCLGLSLPGAD